MIIYFISKSARFIYNKDACELFWTLVSTDISFNSKCNYRWVMEDCEY